MSNPYPPPPTPGYGQPPYSQPIGSQVYVQRGPTNGLGLAAFITSLVGLVLCLGVLSPVGLLLSLFAVFKKPRGFAVAGVVLGLIGTIMLVVVTGGLVLMTLGVRSAVQNIETRQTARSAYEAIEAHRAEYDGTLPGADFGTALIDGKRDAWQTPLRYVPSADTTTYAIQSAGPDTVFDTRDDIVMDEDELRSWQLPTTFPSVEVEGTGPGGTGAVRIGTH
jgi:type II secretory pathway pseudopilin PulG